MTLPATAPSPTSHRTPWAWTLATFFGVGLPRGGKGMGTVASAVTALLWGALCYWHPSWLSVAVTGTAALVVTLIGIPVGTIVAREAGVDDPSFVVIDEVAGQLIALIAAPLTWKYFAAAFILFRVFDMTKPPPLRQLENLNGGAGIMLDDVGAGLLALAVLRITLHFGLV